MANITQREIVMEYFTSHPLREIKHPEVVDWVTEEYLKRTGGRFRDPDRQIRSLHQSGFLIKVTKGVYKYDPDAVEARELEEFSPRQKQAVLKRDGYRCVICGARKAEGAELHVDHIKPRDQGGKATVQNGQTLCGMHNYRKRNLGQTEMAKKMFIRLYAKAKSDGDEKIMRLCEGILEIYERENINGHIEWER